VVQHGLLVMKTDLLISQCSICYSIRRQHMEQQALRRINGIKNEERDKPDKKRVDRNKCR